MRIFGLQVTKAAAPVPVRSSNSITGVISEPFAGAWQRNIAVDSREDLLSFSAVYACVDLISSDISKLGVRFVKRSGRIWQEYGAPRFTTVLRRPNPYQNRIQFIKAWVISRQLFGNTYVFKRRDALYNVIQLYVLDPTRVRPLVSPDGSIFYEIAADPLRSTSVQITVPASEIIHDRGMCPWHPLIGVSPIIACAAAGTMGNRIATNSQTFFDNLARPGGLVTSPNKISDETAERLKDFWTKNFGGAKSGNVAIAGDGLDFKQMTMSATDAQLIEQMRWSVEDVARCFHVPLHKIGADPTGSKAATNVAALEQSYYSDCLQAPIEDLELCLDEGLEVPDDQGFEVDVDGLLRMDPAARYDAHTKAVAGGWMTPNEARAAENLPSVAGGDTPYLQQQNYSLGALAKRDKEGAPSSAPAAPPAADPAKEPKDGD